MQMPIGITDTVDKAEVFVSALLDLYLPENLVFHNIVHTRQVVKATLEISESLKLLPTQIEIVLIAAWFHDTGHIVQYEYHEKISQEIAKNFLLGESWETSKIKQVLTCIAATKIPQEPHTILEQVLCDADLYHLTSKDYLEQLDRLREEWKAVFNRWDNDHEWIILNLEFLANHQFFTDYGKYVLDVYKDDNINLLLDRL